MQRLHLFRLRILLRKLSFEICYARHALENMFSREAAYRQLKFRYRGCKGGAHGEGYQNEQMFIMLILWQCLPFWSFFMNTWRIWRYVQSPYCLLAAFVAQRWDVAETRNRCNILRKLPGQFTGATPFVVYACSPTLFFHVAILFKHIHICRHS